MCFVAICLFPVSINTGIGHSGLCVNSYLQEKISAIDFIVLHIMFCHVLQWSVTCYLKNLHRK